MNKTKLAITLDKDVADFVKRYASDKGLSVSAAINRMVLSWAETARYMDASLNLSVPDEPATPKRKGKAQA